MQRLQTLFLLTASLSLAASQLLGQGRQVDPTEAKLAAQAEAVLKAEEGTWESVWETINAEGEVTTSVEGIETFSPFNGSVRLLRTKLEGVETENTAFRFYNPTDQKLYFIDVTPSGRHFILEQEVGNDTTISEPFPTAEGSMARLRFSVMEKAENWKQIRHEISHDDGKTWREFRRQRMERVNTSRPQSAQDPSAPQGMEAFRRMMSYLAGGSGRWRAPNPNHDPTSKTSPEAIGLWFQTSARGNLLQLTVVGHVGSQFRKWSESYWLWHPGRKEILYHEVGPNGAVRMGTTHFTDEHTFVTLTEAVSPTGSIASNRGENVIVDENAHRTTAYALDPEGKWIEQNALTWTRTPPGGAAQ